MEVLSGSVFEALAFDASLDDVTVKQRGCHLASLKTDGHSLKVRLVVTMMAMAFIELANQVEQEIDLATQLGKFKPS